MFMCIKYSLYYREKLLYSVRMNVCLYVPYTQNLELNIRSFDDNQQTFVDESSKVLCCYLPIQFGAFTILQRSYYYLFNNFWRPVYSHFGLELDVKAVPQVNNFSAFASNVRKNIIYFVADLNLKHSINHYLDYFRQVCITYFSLIS